MRPSPSLPTGASSAARTNSQIVPGRQVRARQGGLAMQENNVARCPLFPAICWCASITLFLPSVLLCLPGTAWETLSAQEMRGSCRLRLHAASACISASCPQPLQQQLVACHSGHCKSAHFDDQAGRFPLLPKTPQRRRSSCLRFSNSLFPAPRRLERQEAKDATNRVCWSLCV